MGRKFWLIQRGKIRDDALSKTSLLSGSSDAIIDPDYMGAAEFEFGQIPAAYIRMRYSWDLYDLFDTGEFTTSGKKLYLICNKDKYSGILEDIKDYVKTQYVLKEYSNLQWHFRFMPPNPDKWTKEDFEFHLRTDFWWDIDKTDYQKDGHRSYERDNGDWIAFVTKDERIANHIKRIISRDVEILKEMYSEEELKEKYNRALVNGWYQG